ncbi:acylneuraminate cytidylyltransferase family protein [archaeon]|nr:acylneuraminate cytidylyltransferase family protein [archaeon]
MSKNSISIISARGGSKGLPNKNIKPLFGKPLICYTIEQSLRCFDRTVLSSDSTDILSIGRSYKDVEIVKRPQNLSTDDTPKLPVIRHAINELELKSEIIADIQPTSPLRKDESIHEAIEKLNEHIDSENVISISSSDIHPEYNLVTTNNNYLKLLKKPTKPITGRNKLSNHFYLNGSFFIWRYKHLLAEDNTVIRKKSLFVETPKLNSIDIDDIIDFKFAEFIMKTHNEL